MEQPVEQNSKIRKQHDAEKIRMLSKIMQACILEDRSVTIRIQIERKWFYEKKEFLHRLRSCPFIMRLYEDAYGLVIEVDKEAKSYLTLILYACNLPFKYEIIHNSADENITYTALSPVRRAFGPDRTSALTGLFCGQHTHVFAVTVGHLLNEIGSEVKFGGRLRGNCCAKETMVIANNKKYTADIALFKLLPSDPESCEHIDDVYVDGKLYKRQLWKGDEKSIIPGTEVIMFNQDGEMKIGKVYRILYCDKKLELYNVIQIFSKDQNGAFAKEGDSGCCVYLRLNTTNDASDSIYAIGMVVSNVVIGDMVLTNVVWLRTVLTEVLRKLPPSVKVPSCLSKDEGLPLGVDFAEGVEFLEAYVEKPNQDCHVKQIVQAPDSGIGLATGLPI